MENEKTIKDKKISGKKGNGAEGTFFEVHPNCINIECAFNSALDVTEERNKCRHPKVTVKSESAEITIAICTEFRSKKDYKFHNPDIVVDLRTNEKSTLGTEGKVEANTVEFEGDEPVVEEKPIVLEKPAYHTPNIITSGESGETVPNILYNLTDNKFSDFLALRRLYQPYLKRGIIFSIIFHLVLIWLFYIFIARSPEDQAEVPNEQRIVVVEETPLFTPPDIDKKPEEEKIEDGSNTDLKNKEIRPKITPRTVTPKIHRPKTADTTDVAIKDTNKLKLDSNFVKNLNDTSRFLIPDSLRNTFAENQVGMSLWWPKSWKLMDSRFFNPSSGFTGVTINTDSTSEDPGTVSIFINLEDDGKVNNFNKTLFKSEFKLDDTSNIATAFATDAIQTGGNETNYKYYIFYAQPPHKVYINAFLKNNFIEKYKKYVDAIVRSIKFQKPESKNP